MFFVKLYFNLLAKLGLVSWLGFHLYSHRNSTVKMAGDSLVSLGEKSVDYLTSQHLNEDTEGKYYHVSDKSLRLLIRIDEPALEKAVELLHHDVPVKVVGAAGIIRAIAPEKGTEALAEVLERKKGYQTILIACAEAMGVPGNTAAVEPLVKVMGLSEFGKVRKAAATALGEIGDRKALPYLEKAFAIGYNEAGLAIEKIKSI